jgi:hypothetical protein
VAVVVRVVGWHNGMAPRQPGGGGGVGWLKLEGGGDVGRWLAEWTIWAK